MIKLLLIVATLYLIFLWDYTLTVTSKKPTYTLTHCFDYNGLLWVILDHWSIRNYQSNDKAIKWISYKRTITHRW